MFRAPLLAHRISVIKNFRATRLVRVMPGEIRQAFGNLVSNAIDAMGAHGGTLRIHATDATDHETQTLGVRIVFSDSGTGIPAAALARIFDAFYTTKELKGSGLGLWLTSEVITKHGGRLRVRSRTDGGYKGTLFDVFLPKNSSES